MHNFNFNFNFNLALVKQLNLLIMKKLFLTATLCVAGLVSAKENVKNDELNTKNCILNFSNTENVLLRHLVQITASCGKIYYLDTEQYASFEELMDAVDYFDAQKCPIIN